MLSLGKILSILAIIVKRLAKTIGTAVYRTAIKAIFIMNTTHCLICELIKCRTEMIYAGLLLVKKSQLDMPTKAIASLDALRVKPTYRPTECCAINQKRLTRCEHELELEIARLKLRTEQFCFQQEQLFDKQNLHMCLA